MCVCVCVYMHVVCVHTCAHTYRSASACVREFSADVEFQIGWGFVGFFFIGNLCLSMYHEIKGCQPEWCISSMIYSRDILL